MLSKHRRRINGGYDLSFDIDNIIDPDGSLPLDPSFVLQTQLKYLLIGQAEATWDSTDDGYMSSSRQLIIKTITDSFTFSCDMGTAKGLLQNSRLLKYALSFAERSKFQSLSVFIPILHFHLVDESGFLLPVEHWDVMNLGSFLKPNSY